MVKASAKKTANSESTVQVQAAQVPEVAVPPSKKSKKTQEVVPTPVVETAPVVPATPVTPVTTTSKKSGKRAQTQETVAAPAVVAPVVEATPTPTKGGKRSSKAATPVVEATPAPVVQEEAQEEAGGRGKRFFRCVYRATDGSVVNAGRYSGKKPKQAAAKALTAIVKKNNVTTGESVTFLIQECTRGSRKKKYSYEGSQVFLPNPVQITIRKKDGTSSSISYAKNNVLKKIALSECGDLVNVELGADEEAQLQPVEAGVKVQAATTKTARGSKKSVRGGKSTKTEKAAKSTTSAKATKVKA
jgi:hypothetical protein